MQAKQGHSLVEWFGCELDAAITVKEYLVCWHISTEDDTMALQRRASIPAESSSVAADSFSFVSLSEPICEVVTEQPFASWNTVSVPADSTSFKLAGLPSRRRAQVSAGWSLVCRLCNPLLLVIFIASLSDGQRCCVDPMVLLSYLIPA